MTMKREDILRESRRIGQELGRRAEEIHRRELETIASITDRELRASLERQLKQ